MAKKKTTTAKEKKKDTAKKGKPAKEETPSSKKKASSTKDKKAKPGSEKKSEPKKSAKKKSEPKKPAKKKPVKSKTAPKKTDTPKKTTPAKKPSKPEVEIPDNKALLKMLNKVERENSKLKDELKLAKEKARDQAKHITGLEGRMDTRVKREEVIMKALNITSRTKKGRAGVIEELNRAILKTEEYLLHTGKRIDRILSAIKNHREYLIKLNKKVHKLDARKRIEMEVDIMNNTLSIMALSGFDINKSLFNDVKKIRKAMEKKDLELSKLKKRMERLESKFEEEMERFDYESIFKKGEDIPGYR